MTTSLRKNMIREIRSTWKRFLSIALMAFLGAGFFAGINAASLDMQLSADRYLDAQNCFDLQVMSTMGLTEDDVQAVLNLRGMEDAVGIYSENVFVDVEGGNEKVKVLSIPEHSTINAVRVVNGTLATKANECMIPQSLMDITGKKIGDTLTITETLEDEEESSFRHTKLKITGVIESPLYVYGRNNERGTGGVADYMYVPQANIAEDYFTELYVTVHGAANLDSFGSEYEALIDNQEVLLKSIADDRELARYEQVTGDANAEIDDAQQELNEKATDARKQLDDAWADIETAQQEIDDGKRELDRSRRQAQQKFADAQAAIDDGARELQQGRRAFEREKKKALQQRAQLVNQREDTVALLTELNKKKQQTTQTITDLQQKRAQLVAGMEELQTNIDKLKTALEQARAMRENMIGMGMDTTEIDAKIVEMEKQLNPLEEMYSGYELQLNQLDAGMQQAKDGLIQIDTGIAQAQRGIEQIDHGIQQIDDGLAAGRAKISKAAKELEEVKRQLRIAKSDAYAQMNTAERKLLDGQTELEEGKAEFSVQKADFDKEIANAQKEIDDARAEVADINQPTWYVLTREGNPGLSSFSQDSNNLKRIGFTFPLIFFLVAVLISLSSMTRMVEEQRGLIGTLKALGYSGGQIASKYLIYAMTASVLGSILGELAMFPLLPRIVWDIYSQFYTLPAFYTPIDPFYGAVGLIVCSGCIIVATAAACWHALRQTPAYLMRPKAPNPGKRVLLERITPIWKRLSFSHKVTARNLFRYKKRFIMTICGVAGCSMLVTTGFGLKDSIEQLIPMQYGTVMHYDLLAVTSNDVDETKYQTISEELSADRVVKQQLPMGMESVNIVTHGGKSQELELFVPSDAQQMRNYISLYETDSKNEILCGDQILLTRQIAEILDVSAGDCISVRRENGTKADMTVGAVVDNYLNHYAFLSAEGYHKAYGEGVKNNAFLLNTTDIGKAEQDAFVKKLNDDTRFNVVSVTADAEAVTKDRLSLINQVVLVLIIAAASLAMVVLYNLSTINISERIRELATIKVLGFYDMEVYQYNTRESVVLTVFGTIVGLIGGRGLTAFILSTMEMQGIVIIGTVAPMSYLFAGVLTIIFATIINFATYFSLKKINMVEALKSVE